MLTSHHNVLHIPYPPHLTQARIRTFTSSTRAYTPITPNGTPAIQKSNASKNHSSAPAPPPTTPPPITAPTLPASPRDGPTARASPPPSTPFKCWMRMARVPRPVCSVGWRSCCRMARISMLPMLPRRFDRWSI